MQNSALLSLLQLTSPSLPIGGFAYSQGLEYALDSGWINSRDSLQDWLDGMLTEGLGHVDLPLLARCADAYRSGDDLAVIRWNQWLRANRETKELLFEDEQLGLALRRLLVSLDKIAPDDQLPPNPTYASQFARAGVLLRIDTPELLHGFGWSWLENQIAVACKVMPLGQTAAQQLIIELLPRIEQAVVIAMELEDQQLGSTLPGLALASSLHETQYSRLFRS